MHLTALFSTLNFLFVLLAPLVAIYRWRKTKADLLLAWCFSISAFLFLCCLSTYSADFNQVIDIKNAAFSYYSPIASKHSFTISVFAALSLTSLLTLWVRGKQLPPLLFLFLNSCLLIGVALSVLFMLQVSFNSESNDTMLFFLMPTMFIVVSAVVIFRLIISDGKEATSRTYKHPAMQLLNKWMTNIYLWPVWTLVLTAPAFLLIVLILTVFGQDSHAVTKAFTETSTWYMSQKEHPPYLNPPEGHYLCTVAAYGSPEIVKPIRMGRRHGYPIVVNRQLQVANAFEQVIQESLPRFHRLIRRFYDRYGYPLSQKIETLFASNLVYLLMKPLEYLFILFLYTTCVDPEARIARQYL
jgi:hypothetical protein